MFVSGHYYFFMKRKRRKKTLNLRAMRIFIHCKSCEYTYICFDLAIEKKKKTNKRANHIVCMNFCSAKMRPRLKTIVNND